MAPGVKRVTGRRSHIFLRQRERETRIVKTLLVTLMIAGLESRRTSSQPYSGIGRLQETMTLKGYSISRYPINKKGEGVARDLRKAFSFYKRAAELGDAPAQCNLGVAYLEGLGAKQNLTEGIKWLRKAARQGDAKAQYSLGMAYYDGEDVRKNIRYAQAWLDKAARQGHKKAAAKLLKIIGAK
jgi:Sel1 repeat-containing protein